jgi:hypothetical protein
MAASRGASPPAAPETRGGGGSWNQLWRQLAQRTWRPEAPTALSGTT